MATDREQAKAELKRILKWIAALSVAMVIAALIFLHLTGGLDKNMVIATVLGVFLSMLLGCGLFAAAFFSDKSGHDQSISDATSRRSKPDDQ